MVEKKDKDEGSDMTETTVQTESPSERSDTAKKSEPYWLRAFVPGLLVALVAGLFVAAFLWPMSAMEPKNIALAVAGPEDQVAQIEGALESQQAGLFDFQSATDRDEIVAEIEAREVGAGMVVGPEGIEFLTASAGNAQVAQMLGQIASGMKEMMNAQATQAIAQATEAAKAQGATAEQILAIQDQAQQQAGAMNVTVTDVVSGGGNAFAGNMAMLPALIGGMAGGMIAMFFVKRPAYRVITVVTASAGAGLAGAAALGPWFGMLPGNYWLQALALGVGALAVSSLIAGLGTLIGKVGIALGAVLVVLIGNPWGGFMVPPEFLSGFMGTLGSYLPNGNVVSLMKGVNYFPEASVAGAWWTLAIWSVVGIAMILIGAALRRPKEKVA